MKKATSGRNTYLVYSKGHFLYSRIPPVENGRFRLDSTGFFWSFLLSVESIFLVFVVFLETVGVWEYCCTAGEVGWHLCALRAFSASNGSTNLRPSELVALGLAESRQSYDRGVALSRELPKLQQVQPVFVA